MIAKWSSSAAQVIIAVTPIVGIVIGGIVIFFYLLWRHREIALQIKTGKNPEKFNLKLFSLLTGLLLIGVGIVLSLVFFLVKGEISYTLLGGLIPCALGICLIAFYKLYPDSE
jgi:hypothetical protein